MAEDEVRSGVGVDGIVFAEGVNFVPVCAESDGIDAKMPELAVALRLAGIGDWTRYFASVLKRADIPELDRCIGFGPGEEEVLLSWGEE